MTTTATVISPFRTIEDLTADAETFMRPGDPNRAYHVAQYIERVIRSAERAAYAEDDRRTIRTRYLAAVASPTAEQLALVALAEAGDLIDPAHLMATVPDEFGRVSPFCIYVRPAGGREYASRNLDLATAVRLAQSAAARGDRVSVSFDTCG